MILDNISNADRYREISPLFKKAFEFLRSENIGELPDGKYEIEGQDLFAIVNRIEGKAKENAKLEFHNKYIDIQYLLEGSETHGWKSRQDCRVIKTEYSEEKEAGFFADEIENWISLKPGEFAVYFPEDAHAPAVSEGSIHKVIIKAAVKG